jgi:hypothetical protein
MKIMHYPSRLNGLVYISEMVFESQRMPAFIKHQPAIWQGAPVAALRREFQTAHSPSGRAIPTTDRNDLETLYKPYFTMDEDELDGTEAK